MSITIDPEFANLCPALKPEEKAGLEADLVAAGRALDALKLWGDVLLDGHNRFEICTRLGLPFDTVPVPGIETREQAHNWIISNQLSRRNLSPNEASYLRGKRYNAEKMTPTARAKHAVTSRDQKDLKHDGGEPSKTANRLGAELGVKAATIKRDAVFAAAVDSIAANIGEDIAREIRAGQSGMTKTQVREIGKMEPAQQADAIKTAKAKPKKVTAAKLGKIKPMERDQISEAQKESGKNFLHAIRILYQMKYEPEVLAMMKWPENWREAIDKNLADATSYLADFSSAWKPSETPQ